MSRTFGFVFLFGVLALLLPTNADRPIIPVRENGKNVNISTVGQPLPSELTSLMCKMPSLPPGQHICKNQGSKDTSFDLDSTWYDICNSIALILGYEKGACLSVESPQGSNRMYSVCALTVEESDDPQDSEKAVYLTTERLSVPVPRDQRCASNGFKVFYEKTK